MTERRMTKVMPQSDCFCKVFIQTQCFCYRTRILGHFQRMCKPRSIMISFRKKKNLRLLFQPSESFTMKNPVTISLKSRSDITRFLFSFPSLRGYVVSNGRVTVPWAASNSYLPSGLTSTLVIIAREPKAVETISLITSPS